MNTKNSFLICTKIFAITISIFLLHLSLYGATDDTYISLSDYASLSAALSSIGSSKKMLLIDKNDTITADVTVPANVSLKFTRPYKFTINSNIELTINSSVIAPPDQIFSGSGTVAFVESTQKQIYPHWFYDDSGDWTDAFQSAIDSSGGIEIIVPRQEYVVEGTITLREDTTLIGVGTRKQSHTQSSPSIFHDPTTSGAHLFILETTNYFVGSVKVANLTLVGQNDSSEGDCLHLDRPFLSTFSNLNISGFKNGISIINGVVNSITNCIVNNSQETCLRIRGGGITTASTIQKCYFRSSPWACIIEEEAAMNTSFIDTIFESTTSGGVNIYQGNDFIEFIGCYSENIPTTVSAAPIFRIGVDGTSTMATFVSIVGGGYAGVNDTAHADSAFIEADKAQLNISGSMIKRVGNFMTTTTNTERISVYGTRGIQITDSISGIANMGKFVGELPFIYLNNGELQAKQLTFNSNYSSKWNVRAVFHTTNPDLVWEANGTEKLRFDANGQVGIGTIPKATLHSTGSTILGAPVSAVSSANMGNSQINIYLDETGGNLKFKIRKSNGDYETATVPFD